MAALDQTFLVKLALSFLIGSIWVTTVTVIAERFGSKIGGFIGGLPSTIVIALLFIGLSQSTADASRAAIMIPLVMGVNGVFIMIYLALVRQGVIKALGAGLFWWFVVNGLVVWLQLDGLWFSIIGWLVMLGISYYITEYIMTIASRGGIRVPYTLQQMLMRGVVSGFIISMAVLVSRLAGPVIGGIFSTFPVVFMSTLFITYRTGGCEFSRAVAKTLMLSGMINVGVYAITAHFAYQHLSLFPGTLITVLISALSALGTFRIIRRRS
ncbi:MAG: DUF3147 family protein [Candidatus Marinimicrobia bacterium]|nr:DUF3147 family protein [Candidatus Neomarinimicrobiota bacterium]